MCYKATFRHSGEAIADYLMEADDPLAVLEDARQKAETIANIVRLNGGKKFKDIRAQDFEIQVMRFSTQLSLLEMPEKPMYHSVDPSTCTCESCTRMRQLYAPGTYRATFYVMLGDSKIELAKMERDGTARDTMIEAQKQLDTIFQVLSKDPMLKPYIRKPHLSIHVELVDAQLSLIEIAPAPEHRIESLDFPVQPNPLRLPEEKKPRRKKAAEESPIQLEERE